MKERIDKIWKSIKVMLVIILLLAITVSSQRTDIEEKYTSYSDMSEYKVIFYDTVGNDSIYVFESDTHNTSILLLNGTDRSAKFYGIVNFTQDIILDAHADESGTIWGNKSIYIKPNNDNDDFFNFSAFGGIPVLNLTGTVTSTIATMKYLDIAPLDYLNFKPSHDYDDFFRMKTVGNLPTFMSVGAPLNITADNDLYLFAEDDILLVPRDTIDFKPSGDMGDYIRMYTETNIPHIESVGATPLNITGSQHIYMWSVNDILIRCRDDLFLTPRSDLFLQPTGDIIVTGWGSGVVRSNAGTLYVSTTAGNPFNQDLNTTNSTTFANLNVTENITGNYFCAEAYFHYHTGRIMTFVNDVYYNLTFNATTYMNGFTYDGDANLTCTMPGRYAANFQASGSGQNNKIYYLSVGINGVEQIATAVHKKLTAGGDILTMTGTGFLNLTNGDVVSLMIREVSGGGAGVYYGSNLNLVRIGDI